MSRSGAIKIVATVIGIGGAIALLLTASISKGAEYYTHAAVSVPSSPTRPSVKPLPTPCG